MKEYAVIFKTEKDKLEWIKYNHMCVVYDCMFINCIYVKISNKQYSELLKSDCVEDIYEERFGSFNI